MYVLAVSPLHLLTPRASSDILGTACVLLPLKIYVASEVGVIAAVRAIDSSELPSAYALKKRDSSWTKDLPALPDGTLTLPVDHFTVSIGYDIFVHWSMYVAPFEAGTARVRVRRNAVGHIIGYGYAIYSRFHFWYVGFLSQRHQQWHPHWEVGDWLLRDCILQPLRFVIVIRV